MHPAPTSNLSGCKRSSWTKRYLFSPPSSSRDVAQSPVPFLLFLRIFSSQSLGIDSLSTSCCFRASASYSAPRTRCVRQVPRCVVANVRYIHSVTFIDPEHLLYFARHPVAWHRSQNPSDRSIKIAMTSVGLFHAQSKHRTQRVYLTAGTAITKCVWSVSALMGLGHGINASRVIGQLRGSRLPLSEILDFWFEELLVHPIIRPAAPGARACVCSLADL